MSCFTWGSTDNLVKDYTKRKNYHNKKSILIDCVNADHLHVDEYVSDTESIYSIISYQNPNDLQVSDQDSDDDQFIGEILESSKKHKDR